MFIKEAASQLRQDRSVYLVQLVIAGAIIVDYSLTDTIYSELGALFYLLPLLALVPTLILPVGDYTTPLAKRLLLILHHSVAAILLVFLTDIFGPYFLLLVLLLFTSTIWYEMKGALVSLVASYLVVFLGAWYQFGSFSSAPVQQIVLYLVGLAILAFVFEKAIYLQNKEVEKQQEINQNFYFERTRLLSLINSMTDAVIATDEKGKILLYNGATLELFNTNESLHEKSLSQVKSLSDSSNNPVDLIASAVRAHGGLERNDLHFLAEDGSEISLSVSVSPVSTPGTSKSRAGYIVVFRDITKQKTLDEQRDEFISIASHELRTPIAIAEANISTALLPKFSKQLTDEGQKLLDQAHENVVFLSNLINDLHVLSLTEQGRLQLHITEVNPGVVLQRITENYKDQAEEKGLELKVDVDKNIKPIYASLDAIKEILQNFITNSLKYTESGTITLSAKPDENGEGTVFGVKDTGIGISAADQKRIFEKFYRSEDYRTRKNGGTGLGLYITKRLVEKLGGSLWFESKLNKGSAFYFFIPYTPPANEKSEDEDSVAS